MPICRVTHFVILKDYTLLVYFDDGNGTDFDPETLRNWPDYVGEMTARAKRWDTTAASTD
jgi:hypothetical protein